MQNIDLTPIIQAVIALVAAIVSYRLIPWIKAKTTLEQRAYFEAVVSTLVFAAEKLYGAGRGDEKLEYVKRELEARGFTFDRAAIEAAIQELDLLSSAEQDKALG